MSIFTVNPLATQGFNLQDPAAEKVWQSQIALLLSQLTTSVTNPAFYDSVLTGSVSMTFNSSVNQSVACDGASSVGVIYGFTAASSANLTLTHLKQGVPVTIVINPFSSGSSVLFPSATNPAGTAYTTQLLQTGVSGIQTGVSLVSGQFIIGTGMAIGSNLILTFPLHS